jgi:hypothetical protein
MLFHARANTRSTASTSTRPDQTPGAQSQSRHPEPRQPATHDPPESNRWPTEPADADTVSEPHGRKRAERGQKGVGKVAQLRVPARSPVPVVLISRHNGAGTTAHSGARKTNCGGPCGYGSSCGRRQAPARAPRGGAGEGSAGLHRGARWTSGAGVVRQWDARVAPVVAVLCDHGRRC